MFGSGPHRLFFAAWPDMHARARLERLAGNLEMADPDAARWVSPSRYHLTLCFLGGDLSFPSDLAACALEAATRVRMPALEWRIDRVTCFRARRPPCVASGPDTDGSLSRLHNALVDALDDRGTQVADTRSYHPHVTLGHARRGHVFVPRIIAPITFPIHTMVLLHSAPGAHEYRQLGRWLLSR